MSSVWNPVRLLLDQIQTVTDQNLNRILGTLPASSEEEDQELVVRPEMGEVCCEIVMGGTVVLANNCRKLRHRVDLSGYTPEETNVSIKPGLVIVRAYKMWEDVIREDDCGEFYKGYVVPEDAPVTVRYNPHSGIMFIDAVLHPRTWSNVFRGS